MAHGCKPLDRSALSPPLFWLSSQVWFDFDLQVHQVTLKRSTETFNGWQLQVHFRADSSPTLPPLKLLAWMKMKWKQKLEKEINVQHITYYIRLLYLLNRPFFTNNYNIDNDGSIPFTCASSSTLLAHWRGLLANLNGTELLLRLLLRTIVNVNSRITQCMLQTGPFYRDSCCSTAVVSFRVNK